MYWAEALAEQASDGELQSHFTAIAQELSDNEAKIVDELNSVQGVAMDVGGYYKPDPKLASVAMRPSATFNEILAKV